jgi:hypothetical protein
MAARIAHAPLRNFVTAMTTATMNVSTAPVPLITSPFRQPGWRRRRCRRAMPAWDSVKLVNTPTA